MGSILMDQQAAASQTNPDETYAGVFLICQCASLATLHFQDPASRPCADHCAIKIARLVDLPEIEMGCQRSLDR